MKGEAHPLTGNSDNFDLEEEDDQSADDSICRLSIDATELGMERFEQSRLQFL